MRNHLVFVSVAALVLIIGALFVAQSLGVIEQPVQANASQPGAATGAADTGGIGLALLVVVGGGMGLLLFSPRKRPVSQD